MSNEPSTSARALRSQLRESAREASRLRLLEAAALAAADERDSQSALRLALAHAQNFLTADAGIVLRLESSGLRVQASQGFGLPPGARVAVSGVIGSALRAPIIVRERTVSPLRLAGREAVAVEVLVPLRVRGNVGGLIAMSSARPIALPDVGDSVTLQAFAAILGAIIEEPRAARATRAPRREAMALISRLTPREQQVFALLPRGLSNAELAQQLGIATGTIKVHVERILHKLGVRDRTQAAVRATEWGFGK